MAFWGLAFGFAAIVMAGKVRFSLKASKLTSCRACGAPSRFMEPYYMCDTCESMIGVRIRDTNHF
jgi:hypothetical protein